MPPRPARPALLAGRTAAIAAGALLPLGTLAVTLGAPTSAHAQTYSIVHTFDRTNGDNPTGGVTLDAAGNLYGTTHYGGTNDSGTVWKIDAITGTFSVLGSFTGTNGSTPLGDVAVDAFGNVYATSYRGGAYDAGTVVMATSGGSSLSLLASLNPSINGNTTYAGPTLDAAGNLFGVAASGGPNGGGTVWEIPAGGSSISVLGVFNTATTGANPYGSVTLDSVGNIYGTTPMWGVNNAGAVWELGHGSNSVSLLASFDAATTGNASNQGMVRDAAGNLYGTTSSGGANGFGTVWELPRGSSTIVKLADFSNAVGTTPQNGRLTIDAAGNLFGVAKGGGAYTDGTVWELAAGSHTIKDIFTFDGTLSSNGQAPEGTLALDALGNLYGTASGPGHGIVFKISGAAVPFVSPAAPEPGSLALGLCGVLPLVGAIAAQRRRRTA